MERLSSHVLLFETVVEHGPLEYVCNFLSLHDLFESLPMVNRSFAAASRSAASGIQFSSRQYLDLYADEDCGRNLDGLMCFLLRENQSFDPTVRVLVDMGTADVFCRSNTAGWYLTYDAALFCARNGLCGALEILLDRLHSQYETFFGTASQIESQWQDIEQGFFQKRGHHTPPDLIIRLYYMFRLCQHYHHVDCLRLMMKRLSHLTYDQKTEFFVGWNNSRSHCSIGYGIPLHQNFYNKFRHELIWKCEVYETFPSSAELGSPLHLAMERMKQDQDWQIRQIPFPWIVREVNARNTAPVETYPPSFLVDSVFESILELEGIDGGEYLRELSLLAFDEEGNEGVEDATLLLNRAIGIVGSVWHRCVRRIFDKKRGKGNQGPRDIFRRFGSVNEVMDSVVDSLSPVAAILNRIYVSSPEEREHLVSVVFRWIEASRYSSSPDDECLRFFVLLVPSIVRSPEFCQVAADRARRSGATSLPSQVCLFLTENGRELLEIDEDDQEAYEESGLPIAVNGHRAARRDDWCENCRLILCWIFCFPCCVVFMCLWASNDDD